MVVLTQTVDAVHATYYFAVHLWCQLFGFTPIAIRGFSALAVTVAVALIYHLGKLLDSARTGWFAAALLAVLPRLTWAASEGRSYALSIATAAAVLVFLVKALQSQQTFSQHKLAKPWRIYVLVAVTAIYVYIYLVLLVIAGIFIARAFSKTSEVFKAVLRSSAIAIVSALPVFVYSLIQQNQVGWLSKLELADLSGAVLKPLFISDRYWAWAWFTILLVGSVWAWATRKTAKLNHSLVQLAIWSFALPASVIILVSLTVKPIYEPRYLGFIAVPAALALAYLMAKIPGRLLVPVALALTIAGGLTTYQAQREPLAKASDSTMFAQAIKDHAHKGDSIIYADFTSNNPKTSRIAFIYESEFKNVADLGLHRPITNWNRIFPQRDPWTIQQQKALTKSRIWLAGDKADQFEAISQAKGFLLAHGFHQVEQPNLPFTFLALFEK